MSMLVGGFSVGLNTVPFVALASAQPFSLRQQEGGEGLPSSFHRGKSVLFEPGPSFFRVGWDQRRFNRRPTM